MAEPWVYAAAGDVTESLEHRTDVLAAMTGPEQVRRLRDGARMFLKFDTQEERQVRRMMETALAFNGAGLWDVPLIQDASPLVSIAGATLSVDTRWCRYVVGEKVLLIRDDPRTFDVGVVESFDADSITLEDAPSYTWGAGTWVMPMVEAMLDGAPRLGRFTGDVAQSQVGFRVTRATWDVERDAGPAAYRGFPVFEVRPDWSTDPDTSYERNLETVDNESGLVGVYDVPGAAFVQHTVQVSPHGREAIHALRQLLSYLGGRWAPLWVPSQAADFVVTAALAPAAVTLDVEWTGFSDWPLEPWRRDIRLELEDGTVLYRRITAAAALGVDQERLTLDAALGVTATAAQVRLVSFLTFGRQDADVAALKFWSGDAANGLAQCELKFRGKVADDV